MKTLLWITPKRIHQIDTGSENIYILPHLNIRILSILEKKYHLETIFLTSV